MFEIILKTLKTKYAHLGLSENILKAKAKQLAKAVKEEAEIDEAVESVQADLEIYQSLSDMNRTLLKELQELKKEGKKSEDKEAKELKKETKVKEEKPNEEVPEWVKALTDSIKTVSDEINILKTEKLKEESQKTFAEKAKQLGIHENFYKNHTSREFETEEAMNEFLGSLKTDQDEFKKSIGAEGLSKHAYPIFGKSDNEDEVSTDMRAFLDSEKQKK